MATNKLNDNFTDLLKLMKDDKSWWSPPGNVSTPPDDMMIS